MAASMVRSKIFACQKNAAFSHLLARHVSQKTYKFGAEWDPHPTYYVLLPEVPVDTEETNAVMRAYREYPQYDLIKPSAIIAGTCKYAILGEVELGKHILSLREPGAAKTFETVVEPLDAMFAQMKIAQLTARSMAFLKAANSDYKISEYVKAFLRVNKQVYQVQRERYNTVLYNAMKELEANQTDLDDYQKRLLNFYLMYAEHSGACFSGKEKVDYDALVDNVKRDRKEIEEHIAASNAEFALTIDDINAIAEMPKELLARLSENTENPSAGPWSVNLYAHKYEPFMEYCNRRSMREKAYMAMVQRGTGRGRNHLQKNNHIIRTLRIYNQNFAEMFGYKSEADMHIEKNRMAGTVENVVSTIETFRSRLKETSDKEVKELEDYAKSKGFGGKDLEMWDVPYWRRRHRDHLYPLNESEVSQYFPLPEILENLLNITSEMFDITFKECTSEVQRWDDQVRFFKVYDKKDLNTELGAFYIDPYIRQGKGMGNWVHSVSLKCDAIGSKPITHLSFDFDPPFHGVSTFLDHKEVMDLLKGFGNMLQQVLTTVPYYEISSQDHLDTDARNICANVILYFFNSPNKLRILSSENPDKETIPDETLYSILKRHNHLKTHDKMYELFMSAFDIEMSISEEHWHDARKRMWYDYMCIPLQEEDEHPCSMREIFLDYPAVNVYCSHWSQMVAADIVEAMEEAELESPEKFATVCKRYRDTYLSLGAGVPSIEVFRRFRGRDPSPDALLKRFDQPLALR